jgi:hypothetical protein
MLNRLLNQSEEITYSRLSTVCKAEGAHVFPKVRLKDIFPVASSGITNDEFRFCLQAHFDFSVTDEQYEPLFAVEFDGDVHLTPEQRVRDERKNALCTRFELPLLRINANYLNKRYRTLDLLSYITEVWFSAKSFYDARNAGYVPMDEPFIPESVISSPGHAERFPFWLGLDVLLAIRQLHRQGRILQELPSHIVGQDSNGNYRAISFLFVTRDHAVFAETAMRKQQFPIIDSDFLPDIAMHDLYDRLLQYLDGHATAITRQDFEKRLKPYKDEYVPCSSFSWDDLVDFVARKCGRHAVDALHRSTPHSAAKPLLSARVWSRC